MGVKEYLKENYKKSIKWINDIILKLGKDFDKDKFIDRIKKQRKCRKTSKDL